MDSTASLARRLAEAFGDADAVIALLADDIEWWITPTVGILGSPSVGKAAVAGAMQVIFGQIYTDVRVEVHGVISEGDLASVRLTLRATGAGRPYENEYCLWVRQRDGQIDRVWEYLDVAHATAQLSAP